MCEMVRKYLQDFPDLDVNSDGRYYGGTALYRCCSRGHANVLRLLLAHPRVDVNVYDGYGTTALMTACDHGASEIVGLLLVDPRLDVKRVDNGMRTALWHAAYKGQVDVVKRLLACERDVGVHCLGWNQNIRCNISARGVSQSRGHFRVASLLHCFETQPAVMRLSLQIELGLPGASAAFLFAVIVFICDGFLSASAERKTLPARFFAISENLPMELQMVLSLRAFGLPQMFVAKGTTELAFRAVVVDLFL